MLNYHFSYVKMNLPTLLQPGFFTFDKRADVPQKYEKILNIKPPIDIIISIIKDKLEQVERFEKYSPMNNIYFLNSRTGSGKSTIFVQNLFNNFIKNLHVSMYVSEPRVILCSSNANEIIRWDKTMKLGQNIGYITGPTKIMCESRTGSVQYCTPQIIANKLQSMLTEDEIEKCNTKIIMIDETHLLDISVLQLLYLTQVFIMKYHTHKNCPIFIFTSATMDIDAFVHYFFPGDETNIFKNPLMIGYIEGASNFKVNLEYIPEDHMSTFLKEVGTSNAFKFISKYYVENFFDLDGDVLIFSPKTKFIHMCAIEMEQCIEGVPVFIVEKGMVLNDIVMWRNKHRNENRVLVIEFARNLSAAADYLLSTDRDQDPEAITFEKKIIITTPVIETGKTISTLALCIDTGTALQQYFNPLCSNFFGMNLRLIPINKSGAIQRMGRVGRERPGTCLRFYTEKCFEHFTEFEYPSTVNNYCLSELLFNFLQTQKKYAVIDLINENKYLYKLSVDILIKSINDLIAGGFYNMFGERVEYKNKYEYFNKSIAYIQYLYYVKRLPLFESALIIFLNEKMLPNELHPSNFQYNNFRVQLDDIKGVKPTLDTVAAIKKARNLVTDVKYNTNYKLFANISNMIFDRVKINRVDTDFVSNK